MCILDTGSKSCSKIFPAWEMVDTQFCLMLGLYDVCMCWERVRGGIVFSKDTQGSPGRCRGEKSSTPSCVLDYFTTTSRCVLRTVLSKEMNRATLQEKWSFSTRWSSCIILEMSLSKESEEEKMYILQDVDLLHAFIAQISKDIVAKGLWDSF